MKISCPSCEAKYSIGDEKVQNRLAKIRCRKCGVDIVIDGRVEPPSITLGGTEGADAPVSSTAGGSPEFTVDFAENDQRTLTLADIVAAYNAGYVTAETYVWSEGMAEWTPLGQVPSIVSALNAGVASPAAPAAAPMAHTQPQTAAARATTKGSGRDLFGKVAHAGSEEDVAAAHSGYEPQPASATTGVRNESSVLFSLSALTATTKSKTVPTPSASVTSALDDSGLIDLKALASQASSPAVDNSAPLGGAAPLGLAPLGGLGGPLGGMPFGGGVSPSPLTAADLAPPPKNKTGLFIGGGIAVAAIIVALAIALRPEPPAPAPVVFVPPPKPALTVEPPPTASAAIAKPPPTGTEETPKKAPPKYSGPARGGKKGGSSSGSSSGSGSESTPKTTPSKPPPSGGHCGCAATDLPCNMRCSAKGG